MPDIIFTSGGTEANNMVLHSAPCHFWKTYPRDDTAGKRLPHIVTSNIEHDSIRLVLEKYLEDGKAGN